MRLGLWLYDRLGDRSDRDRHRRIDAAEMLQRFPTMRTEGLRHGIVYRDYQTDDARLTLALARSAAARGATILTWTRADRIGGRQEHFEIQTEDRLTGARSTIGARAVVTATGAFDPPPSAGKQPMGLRISKGTHLMVPLADIGLQDHALVLPETDDKRVLFLVPWQGWALIGTTDTEYDLDPAHPAPTPDDIEYLMRHVHQYLAIDDPQVMSSWAGLRALADTGRGSTSSASREHKVRELQPGHIQVAGGKLTEYRRIAAQVVDKTARRLGVSGKSTTGHVPLVGAGIDDTLRRTIEETACELGLEGWGIGSSPATGLRPGGCWRPQPPTACSSNPSKAQGTWWQRSCTRPVPSSSEPPPTSCSAGPTSHGPHPTTAGRPTTATSESS